MSCAVRIAPSSATAAMRGRPSITVIASGAAGGSKWEGSGATMDHWPRSRRKSTRAPGAVVATAAGVAVVGPRASTSVCVDGAVVEVRVVDGDVDEDSSTAVPTAHKMSPSPAMARTGFPPGSRSPLRTPESATKRQSPFSSRTTSSPPRWVSERAGAAISAICRHRALSPAPRTRKIVRCPGRFLSVLYNTVAVQSRSSLPGMPSASRSRGPACARCAAAPPIVSTAMTVSSRKRLIAAGFIEWVLCGVGVEVRQSEHARVRRALVAEVRVVHLDRHPRLVGGEEQLVFARNVRPIGFVRPFDLHAAVLGQVRADEDPTLRVEQVHEARVHRLAVVPHFLHRDVPIDLRHDPREHVRIFVVVEPHDRRGEALEVRVDGEHAEDFHQEVRADRDRLRARLAEVLHAAVPDGVDLLLWDAEPVDVGVAADLEDLPCEGVPAVHIEVVRRLVHDDAAAVDVGLARLAGLGFLDDLGGEFVGEVERLETLVVRVDAGDDVAEGLRGAEVSVLRRSRSHARPTTHRREHSDEHCDDGDPSEQLRMTGGRFHAKGSQFLVQDLAELLADFAHLLFGQPGVQQVEPILAALEADGPQLPVVPVAPLVAGRLVDQHALAHQDQPEHEAEVQLGPLLHVGETLEELAKDFVVDEELLLRFVLGHRRLPERDNVLAVEIGPGGHRHVDPLEARRRLAEGGHELLVIADRVARDGADALRSADLVTTLRLAGGSGRAQWNLRDVRTAL